jgi:hypothetical protein
MDDSKLKAIFDNHLGKISALETLVAALLATASEHQRKIAVSYLEFALSGGQRAEASEAFLRGFEATKNRILALNPEPGPR